MLGQASAHLGRFAAAIEATKKYVEVSGGTGWAKLELAYAYAIAGKKVESDRLVNEATTGRTDFSPYDMATIHSAQHDADGALQWLEKAIEQRSVDVVWIRVDPRLDGARTDPAFQRVVAQMVPRR
jgi:tetratricopeptide (TPR) repeat protein